MEKSENLQLPYIMPNQAQKHVTHNEAIRYLDALLQISVESRELTEAPGEPKIGSRYIVPEAAKGTWKNRKNNLAAYQDGAWAFYTPQNGWLAWSKAENTILVFNEDEWQPLRTNADKPEMLDLLGINASANLSSRFGVASNDSFFSHEGEGHRLSINKNKTPDAGSITFKTNWTGHAEMGLVGSDNLSIKVTSDGMTWSESLVISAETGKVKFPSGLEDDQLSATPNHLQGMDFIYIDQLNGVDTNDGQSADTPIKSIERLEQIFPIGRRLQIRLLSDVNWDHAMIINYPVSLMEVVGRKSNNTGHQKRLITVVDSKNDTDLPGGLVLNCNSNVYLRSVDINLNTARSGSFLCFTRTFGYLVTYQTGLTRSGTGSCCLFADGISYIPSMHQQWTLDPSAQGYVAKGVSAGKNPNKDWRYPSNQRAF